MKRIPVMIMLLILIGGAACATLGTPPIPLASDTPTPAKDTPTPTTVWFPPTATHTPLPNTSPDSTPTVDTSPRYGSQIFEDDFSDPAIWSLGKTYEGSAALGNNELTLAVSRPNGYLFSLRQDTNLNNFYVEITASPSICRGADEYGLLVRVTPSLEFFRFGLTCDGQARVDRFLSGSASSPHPPTPSGAIPLGAPSSSRMAVWAVGGNLSFYVNNEYLFSIHDPSLSSGGLGIYARAAGEDSVTINFSDLQVFESD